MSHLAVNISSLCLKERCQYLSIQPSINIAIYISIYIFIQTSIFIFIHPSIYISFHPRYYKIIQCIQCKLASAISSHPSIYISIQTTTFIHIHLFQENKCVLASATLLDVDTNHQPISTI